ncbi:hypothetical protein ABB02_02074 [Clostridiaceae bacterium JG1575]|nr:hypothetical protein ABB02_02074 [Clostridiaceae bacterium JG1575]
MFKKKIDRAFDQLKEDQQPEFNEEDYRNSMQDEMEKGDFLALVLGTYRFFLPVFIVIVLLLVILSRL